MRWIADHGFAGRDNEPRVLTEHGTVSRALRREQTNAQPAGIAS